MMTKDKKMVMLCKRSMADNHAWSMTSGCDCQAWLAQERDELVAHEVVPLEWWKKKLRRLIKVSTCHRHVQETEHACKKSDDQGNCSEFICC